MSFRHGNGNVSSADSHEYLFQTNKNVPYVCSNFESGGFLRNEIGYIQDIQAQLSYGFIFPNLILHSNCKISFFSLNVENVEIAEIGNDMFSYKRDDFFMSYKKIGEF